MTHVPESLLVHLRLARDLADRHYAGPPELDGLARLRQDARRERQFRSIAAPPDPPDRRFA